jgi:dolichol-phosphate mannosyltransferase
MQPAADLVSIIVPTWNERDNIAPLLAAVRNTLHGTDFEVLVVDDASSDGTEAAVSRDAQHHANVRLVQRGGQFGLSSAVLEGAARSAGGIVVMMDADFSHDPSFLPLLVKQVRSGSDVVIGSRYVPGARIEGWTLHRRFGSAVTTQFVRRIFRLPVHDPLSGFVAFRREVLAKLPTRFSAHGFKLLLEVLTLQPSLHVSELPITFSDRTRGTSKFGVREMREFVMLCCRLFCRRWVVGPLSTFVGARRPRAIVWESDETSHHRHGHPAGIRRR